METKLSYLSPESTTTYSHPYRVIYVGTDIDVEKEMLKQELAKVNKKLTELEKRIPQEGVIVLRDISREQAKEEIKQLFKTGRTLYLSDLVKELGIDLGTVAEICDELEANGELVIDQNV